MCVLKTIKCTQHSLNWMYLLQQWKYLYLLNILTKGFEMKMVFWRDVKFVNRIRPLFCLVAWLNLKCPAVVADTVNTTQLYAVITYYLQWSCSSQTFYMFVIFHSNSVTSKKYNSDITYTCILLYQLNRKGRL